MKFRYLMLILLAGAASAVAVFSDKDTLELPQAQDANGLETATPQSVNTHEDLQGYHNSLDHISPVVVPDQTIAKDHTSDPPVTGGPGERIGRVVDHVLICVSAKVYGSIINFVWRLISSRPPLGDDAAKVTPTFLHSSMEKMTSLILALTADDNKKTGDADLINLGADDGKEKGDIKHDSFLGQSTIKLVRWDVTDESAHRGENNHDDRPIIGDDLRTHMIQSGLKNITFAQIQTSEHPIAFLSYQKHDDSSHYHWRPLLGPEVSQSSVKPMKKHYPFFDANGAGFKISAQIPTGPKSSPFSTKDAAQAAAVIVNDLFKRRGSFSAVGYKEQSEKTGWVGHKLCFIAEDRRFGLTDESHLCFGKKK